mmetsp:Transcript_59098/g.136349  ORF Transcript_59098/g.136349 Transcript_59098/m.136349 type:complete len:315 (-) Transcript_59098:8-952(-)
MEVDGESGRSAAGNDDDENDAALSFLAKRLRLSEHTDTTPVQIEPYAAANLLLRKRHLEAVQRRARVAERAPVVPCGGAGYKGSTARIAPAVLADVVLCAHAANGRCLQCCGRRVPSLPDDVQRLFYEAYPHSDVFAHPTVEEMQSMGYRVPQRSLVSGDARLAGIAAVFEEVQPKEGETFLDCGSGVGKAVLAFALLYPTCQCAGVELRPALHEAAVHASSALPGLVARRIRWHLGDMFELDWGEASVLLLNSTGFDESLMQKCIEKLSSCQVGSRAIVMSQPLSAAGWKETRPSGLFRFSWGNATVYFYRRG